MKARRNDSILPAGFALCGNAPADLCWMARDALAKSLFLEGSDLIGPAAVRYRFHLRRNKWAVDQARRLRRGEDPCVYPGCQYSWVIEPLGGRLAGNYSLWDNRRRGGRKVFHWPGLKIVSHDEMLEDQDDSLAYRGMGGEEWLDIQQSGWMRSRGWMNLGQPGLTFLGDIGDAAMYANGFAPWYYKPSQAFPGAIVGIPQELTIGSKDDRLVPGEERAFRGRVSASQIRRVWAMVPLDAIFGQIEVREDMGRAHFGSGVMPTVSCGYVRVR